MAQNPFDQLAKQYLEEFLAPVGQVIRNLEVPGEPKFVDVFFAPDPNAIQSADLGLLGQMLQTVCLLEPFRNAPTRHEIRTCLLKLIWIQEDERRKARQAERKLPEVDLPQLWILAATTHEPVLRAFKAEITEQQGFGVYVLAEGLKTAIVAIDQLPESADTLWLRILGRGITQERAIREVLALPPEHPRRNNILRLLASWKVRIDLKELQDFSDQETIMALSQAFLEWEQQTQQNAEAKGRQVGWQEGRQEGRQEGERALLQLLLAQKLGALPHPIETAIAQLSREQLEALAIAQLNFSQIAELETWLLAPAQSHLRQQLAVQVGDLSEETQRAMQGLLLEQIQALGEAIAGFQAPEDLQAWLADRNFGDR